MPGVQVHPWGALLADAQGLLLGIPESLERMDHLGAGVHLLLGSAGAMIEQSLARVGSIGWVAVEGAEGGMLLLPLDGGMRLLLVSPGSASTLRVMLEAHRHAPELAALVQGWPHPTRFLALEPCREESLLAVLERLLLACGAGGSASAELPWRRCLRVLHRACSAEASPVVLRLVDRVATQLAGQSATRFLGAGHWGAVYQLSGGEVLKLTRDRAEAQAAALLVGQRRYRHLPDFTAVAQLGVQGRPSPFFALVREGVEHAGRLRGEPARLQGLVQRLLEELPVSAEDPRLLEKASSEARGLRSDLHQAGIVVEDFHPGNMGLKEGSLCLFDLSLARTEQTPVVPLVPIDACTRIEG